MERVIYQYLKFHSKFSVKHFVIGFYIIQFLKRGKIPTHSLLSTTHLFSNVATYDHKFS